MKIKHVKIYEDWKRKNIDPYGASVFRYAETWVDLMEKEMENGVEIKDIAKETSHKADTEDITGVTYVMAVNILSECWEYGEVLEKWYRGE